MILVKSHQRHQSHSEDLLARLVKRNKFNIVNEGITDRLGEEKQKNPKKECPAEFLSCRSTSAKRRRS